MRRLVAVVAALLVLSTILAAPATAQDQTPPAPPADVLVVGDSLCYGAQLFGRLQGLVEEAGLTADLRCIGGVPLASGIDVVRSFPEVPPVVIVELGTNPTASIDTFRREAAILVRELRARGARAVRWIPAASSSRPGFYDQQNAVIAALHGRDSVEVLDWPAVLAADPELYAFDGIHYTISGYERFARYLADAAIDAADDATVEGLRQQVRRLYLAVMRREPEGAGWLYWTVARFYGVPLERIATLFTAAPEFTMLYGEATEADLVDLVYRNVLGREPDLTGRWYWTVRLGQGMSPGELVVGFSESAEFRAATRPPSEVPDPGPEGPAPAPS